MHNLTSTELDSDTVVPELNGERLPSLSVQERLTPMTASTSRERAEERESEARDLVSVLQALLRDERATKSTLPVLGQATFDPTDGHPGLAAAIGGADRHILARKPRVERSVARTEARASAAEAKAETAAARAAEADRRAGEAFEAAERAAVEAAVGRKGELDCHVSTDQLSSLGS